MEGPVTGITFLSDDGNRDSRVKADFLAQWRGFSILNWERASKSRAESTDYFVVLSYLVRFLEQSSKIYMSGHTFFQNGFMATKTTPTQLAIATLAARGMTNAEIASRLNLAEQTIKNQLHRAMVRMRVRNRVELTLALIGNPPVASAHHSGQRALSKRIN